MRDIREREDGTTHTQKEKTADTYANKQEDVYKLEKYFRIYKNY